MKPFFLIPLPAALLASLAYCAAANAADLQITVTSKLPAERSSETIEISAKDLAPLGAKNLNLVHIKDAEGKDVICQAIDNDGDELRQFDAVIFQSDFKAGETKTFNATAGGKQVFIKDQYKAFGRFVRERFDDFTWENDRIAHRTYGAALETWKGEPLTSSTIDVWTKRTPKMVINDWYLSDDYHSDHGDGADFYSAGLSRGCGGSGLWAGDKLWVSKNFVSSNVLANGPIRVLFELEYSPFDVDGVQVAETKRVSLDAGSQFDHFESRYKPASGSAALTAAAGLKKVPGEKLEANPEEGWILKWEKVEKNAGNQGLAIIAGKNFEKQTEDKLNQLVLVKTSSDHVASYWAGFCWDKAGKITTQEAWKAHVSAFAKALESPLEVKVATK